VYAHLGVLEIATNAFAATSTPRAWFSGGVAPLGAGAKNAVAYLFSLAIFLLLALVAAVSAQLTAGQFLVGILAHAAVFPLLATFGNAVSVYFPVPVRGARLRRVRGTGPIGARWPPCCSWPAPPGPPMRCRKRWASISTPHTPES